MPSERGKAIIAASLDETVSMSWLQAFPALLNIEDKRLLQEMQQQKSMQAPAGQVLFREGDPCRGYVLVLSGCVRVFKTDAEGREILLYRVDEGQACMLTTTCLLGEQCYPAEAVAESDVELVLIPNKLFERLLARSDVFRRFSMGHIGDRICDMMMLIEDVAFGRMDHRLAKVLLRRAEKEGDTLTCTHQELAAELGTAREVVSRILKGLEQRGWVALSRGTIHLLERSMLGQISDL